jgi:general secretion pathway protein E
VGCEDCGHTGYKGRTGVYELMVTGDAERALIHERASEAELRAQALRAGMLPMRDDGERLVSAGRTSREELLRVTRE